MLALLFFPASAHAATVSVDAGVLRVVAAPGDQDSVWLMRAGDTVIVFGNSPLVAGVGCTKTTGVDCPAAGLTSADVSLGDGNDEATIYDSFGLPARIDGGTGNDVLTDGAGVDELIGGEGDDWLFMEVSPDADADTLWGGPGHDRASYGQRDVPLTLSLDDVANDGAAGEQDNIHTDVEGLFGGRGNDVVTGSAGDEVLSGGDGADTVSGLGGNDTLLLTGATHADGGPGDDTFKPSYEVCGNGHETVIGGPGTDTADFSASTARDVSVSLDGVADDGVCGTADFRPDIENVRAGSGGMLLMGSDGPNVLTGGAGDDLLEGAGGADMLAGGGGFDVADYSDHIAPVSLTLDGQADDGAAGEGDLIATDVEDLRGGAGADTLTGDTGANLLDGGPGADVLTGGPGLDGVDYSDRTGPVTVNLDGSPGDGEAGEGDTVGADVEGVLGGAGNDVLTGNAADGFLDGGAGDDHLIDPGGEDDLNGGPGADLVETADGAPDDVFCGAGLDVVWRDVIDTVDGDCESVHYRAVTIVRAPVPRLPRVLPPRLDRTAPKASVSAATRMRAATFRRLGLVVTIRCDEPCQTNAEITDYRALLARGSGTAKFRVRATKTGRKRLRRGTYRVRITVTDGAGNARHLTHTLRLT